jgi:hypothetical protein
MDMFYHYYCSFSKGCNPSFLTFHAKNIEKPPIMANCQSRRIMRVGRELIFDGLQPFPIAIVTQQFVMFMIRFVKGHPMNVFHLMLAMVAYMLHL